MPQKSEDLFTLRNDQKKSAAEGLVELFLEKEENARKEETKTGMYYNYFLHTNVTLLI